MKTLVLAAALTAACAAASVATASEPLSAGPLSLDSFLSQVKSGHQGYRSATESSEGALLRARESEIPTAWSLSFDGQVLDDAKPNPFFQYNSYLTRSYSLGLSKQFSFGTQARISYGTDFTHYSFPPNSPFSILPYNDAAARIDITQPLWRNFGGSETRATEEAIEAGALSTRFSQRYQAKVTLAGAESAYWRLALARQNVEIQRDALDRAQKIYDWNARRANLGLGDRSDSLQAAAALDLRKLQLQAARDDERTASLAFNQARGIDSDQVSEALESLDTDLIDRIKMPERAKFRDDVLAAEQGSRASSANARASIERDLPTLEAFGTLAGNGYAPDAAPAMSGGFSLARPTRVVGLRLRAPLDLGALKDSREGWRREQDAADLLYQRRVFEQEQDWKDLVSKFQESQNRLKLARSIEDAQKRKLVYERERLHRGRTTTYQVLLFEQDYAQAQFSRIQAEADVLGIVATMKTFGGEP